MISIGILLLGTIGAVVAYQSRTTEFTLVGELPANLRLELMVSYEPKAGTDDCVTRKKVQPYKMYLFREVAKQTTDSHYQLTIPTFIKAEGCYLPIRSIKVTAHGQYGEYISYGKTYPKESMEQFAAFFSFFDTDKAEFLAAQPDQYRALCGWTFRILPKGLVKILSCREADKQW